MTSPRTHNDLMEAIRREIPKSRALTFGLLYENDEKEFVVMNNDPISLMSYSLLWFVKINTELLRGVFTTQRFDTPV